MRQSPKILLALLLLVPLATWIFTTGGLPYCCWGAAVGRSCPMAAANGGICPMRGMTTQGSGSGRCQMASNPQLTLPAPLLPVMFLPSAPDGIPVLAPWARSGEPTPAVPAAGFAAAPFHPPTLR